MATNWIPVFKWKSNKCVITFIVYKTKENSISIDKDLNVIGIVK